MTRKGLKLCLIVHAIRAVAPISVKTENVVVTHLAVQTIANKIMVIWIYLDI